MDLLKVTVDGVVTMDLQENLREIERQIEQVRQVAAPDDPDDVGGPLVQVTWLTATCHYR
ncbi:hypothetical protein [Streptomyces sp. NPDC005435]|uniref:hypothetical protein n=1 Tax=Streptomyces sp. NPDC005435 TaxID=3154464 RepID=UPI0034536D33